MKYILFSFLIIIFAQQLSAQDGLTPSIERMQGLWEFRDGNIRAYMIVQNNKLLEIINSINKNESNCYGNPFSYFGFWDSGRHNDEEPKNLSQLEKSGTIISFYDDLGTAYDRDGNLIKVTRRCWLTLNEDSDDPIPGVLRFYYKGTPDVYTKIKRIPNDVLIALKKKPKYWKTYSDFVGMVQKPINVTKATIFKYPAANQPTKMYLIKGDIVEVLRQEKGWVKIRYYGTSVVEGWLKSSDLDN